MYYLDEKKLPCDICELSYRISPKDDKEARNHYNRLISIRNYGRKNIKTKTKETFDLIEKIYGLKWNEYVFEE